MLMMRMNNTTVWRDLQLPTTLIQPSDGWDSGGGRRRRGGGGGGRWRGEGIRWGFGWEWFVRYWSWFCVFVVLLMVEILW